jgi:protocatechuate 3,4-dioxygenase beta subunit
MKTFWSLVLLTVLASGAAAQTTSIEGRVVARDSGQGIANANVELRPAETSGRTDADALATSFEILSRAGRTTGGTPSVAPQSRTVLTSADGTFSIDNVAPGRYRLYATRSNGYVPAEYGQRSPTGTGVPVIVSSATNMTGISLVMTPTATISGRVLDEDGEPSGYAHVQALKATYRHGRRTLTVVQLVQADDRGVYRLFWLPPGEYYVAAKPLDLRRSSEMMRIPPPSRFGTYEQQMRPTVTAINATRVLNNGEIAESQYVPIYHPGTREERLATAISVAAGQNIQGLDIDVSDSLVPTRRLRGRAINGLTGQPVSRGSLQIIPREAPAILLIPSGTISNGSFEIGGALPGANYLVAEGDGLSGLLTFDAAESDLGNVTLTMWPPVQIAGQVRSSDPPANGNESSVRSVAVNLRRHPSINGLPELLPFMRRVDAQSGGTALIGTSVTTTTANASNVTSRDGTFTLYGLGPGDYAVDLTLPANAYIESIQFGSRDVLRNGLHLDGVPTPARLDIVIGMRGGTMSGTVVDARNSPVAHAIVVAVPDNNRERIDLFKTVTTDASGRFEIRGLAPGDYEFLAFDQLEQGAWQSAEAMRAEDGRGRRVRITEGATMAGDLRVIPR